MDNALANKLRHYNLEMVQLQFADVLLRSYSNVRLIQSDRHANHHNNTPSLKSSEASQKNSRFEVFFLLPTYADNLKHLLARYVTVSIQVVHTECPF